MKDNYNIKSGKLVRKEDTNSIFKRRMINILKWAVYAVVLLISYSLMVSPGLFSESNKRPLLLIPLVVCVAIYEGELAGGIFAIIAGLIWDSGVDTIMGFQVLILYVCCVISALIVKFLLRESIFSAILLSVLSVFIYSTYHFLFVYVIWNHPIEVLSKLFLHDYMSIFLYTIPAIPIYYFIVRLINNKIRPRRSGEFLL